LTSPPEGDIVQVWTPSNEILFRTGRTSHPTKTSQLYSILTEGSFPKLLVDIRAAYGDVSSDGSYLAHSPITSWDP
jgi:tricorn protease